MPDVRELFEDMIDADPMLGADEVWRRATRRRSRTPVVIAAIGATAAAIALAFTLAGDDSGNDAPVSAVPPSTDAPTTVAPAPAPPGENALLAWPAGDYGLDGESALISGRVVIDRARGCVWVGGHPAIWPAGSRLAPEAPVVELPGGQIVHGSDTVHGSGGFHNASSVEQMGIPVPDGACGTAEDFAVFGPRAAITVDEVGQGFLNVTDAYGIAVGPEGQLAVSDSKNNHVSIGYANGILAPVPATFDAPKNVVFDADGRLYVAERDRVRVVDTDGTVRPVVDGLNDPAIAIDPRDQTLLYTTDRSIHHILADGTDVIVAGDADGPSAVCQPVSMSVLDDGSIWFGDLCDKQLRRIEPDGTIDSIDGITQLVAPFGSALAPDGNGGMYFANGRSGEIWHVAPDLTVTTVLTSDRSNVTANECATPGYGGRSEAIAMFADGADLVFVDNGSGNLCRLTEGRIVRFQ